MAMNQKMIKINSDPSFKRGNRVVMKDLAEGLEKYPVRVVNDYSDEKPKRFTYVNKWFDTFYQHRPDLKGCDCVGGCSDSSKCICRGRNKNGKLPYRKNRGLIGYEDRIIYECGPTCKCPPDCMNRVSQHGLQFPLELFKTESKGWGVRSLVKIPKDSFIIEYVGEIINDKEANERSDDTYYFNLSGKNDFAIDGAKYGNVARFINHSCSPNVAAVNVLHNHSNLNMARVMFFAGDTDIPAGEELAYDYNYALDSVVDADLSIVTKECFCGSDQCRGRLY